MEDECGGDGMARHGPLWPGSQALRVIVIDTGIGLRHEQQSRLFGAFMHANTNATRGFGGTGLALSSSRSLPRCSAGTSRFEANSEREAPSRSRSEPVRATPQR